jgi:nitrogen fixation NifU-like protein
MNDLFQAVLLDHARHPRNQRYLQGATATGEGYNPVCGDRCTVYLAMAEGVIKDVSFEGSGCAILLASASLLTLALVGEIPAQAEALAERFHGLLSLDELPDEDGLGDLLALVGVRNFPSRIKCATLPWHGLRAALEAGEGASS